MKPLWGPETDKAIENFPISGRPLPTAVLHWLGRIKAAAAATNAELGLLDPGLATMIEEAGKSIAAGDHDDQFPVDIFQTGSGTSSNMNVNEVISALCAHSTHPNDHVNLGQSSNDVFPTAVHLAALEMSHEQLLPALQLLSGSLAAKSVEFADVVKAGRTHLMDAVPVTLGQEFGGYAEQVRSAQRHVARSLGDVGRIPIGGTAVGTGLNTHPDFADGVRRRLAEMTTRRVASDIAAPADRFAVQGARDALVALSGSMEVVAVALTKVCNDLRWMASGPRTGLGEIQLPALQKGSSIMPGKVNPVIPESVLQVCAQVIGNGTTISVGAMQGNFELNVMMPVIAHNLLESIELLSNSTRVLATRCIDGIIANTAQCAEYADLTLANATALNPILGYDAVARLVDDAVASGRPLREVAREHGLPPHVLDSTLDPDRIAHGGTGTERS